MFSSRKSFSIRYDDGRRSFFAWRSFYGSRKLRATEKRNVRISVPKMKVYACGGSPVIPIRMYTRASFVSKRETRRNEEKNVCVQCLYPKSTALVGYEYLTGRARVRRRVPDVN